MILKPHHIYKATFSKLPSYVSRRNTVLLVPKYEYNTCACDIMPSLIPCWVCIDILGGLYENTFISIGQNKAIFSKPTVSDVFELVGRMREAKSKYYYNFRTQSIEPKLLRQLPTGQKFADSLAQKFHEK